MSRFDISQASQFESRDGGITKGGLVRNGFSEVDGAGERWANMRPSLATSATAGFTGSGLGMFQLGTDLYGMSHDGTANSWSVLLGSRTFSLVAADLGGWWGYAVSTAGAGSTSGVLSPSTWKGFAVSELVSNGGGVNLSLFGNVGTSIFGRLVLHTTTFTVSTGAFNTAAGQTTISFGVGAFATTGTYSGNFT